MEVIREFFIILLITILAVCGLFIGSLIKHNYENKKGKNNDN